MKKSSHNHPRPLSAKVASRGTVAAAKNSQPAARKPTTEQQNDTPPNGERLLEILMRRAQEHPDRVALRVKRQGRYHDINWQEYCVYTCELAAGLLALGLERGETLGLLSANRPEFAYTDLATMIAGGITVAIYTNTNPRELIYILNHSEARFLVIDNAEKYQKIVDIASELEHLKHIILIEGQETVKPITGIKLHRFAEICQLGRTALTQDESIITRSLAAIKPDNTAIIIYTSGTTGPPKGAMLAHNNIDFICEKMFEMVPEFTEHETFISYLPLPHALERIGCLYFSIYSGGTIGFAEKLETVAADIQEIRPTVLYGVPRFYEKVYNGILAAVQGGSWIKRKIFYWALAVGQQAAQRQLKGRRLSIALRIKYWLADRLVFQKLRQRLGGRVKYIASGGAPLSAAISEFFYSVGLPVMEAYGATETSAPATATRPDSLRFGTVGKPLPTVEVKIAEDGEILIRSGGICKGYFKDPVTTARTFVDGWYYSGDVGHFDTEGNLVITDRKKDLIITSAGKNIAPQNIENLLKTSPYINQVMVHGDRRKYLTA
ncbi:MAG: long-chain fatty acid--CoA ligase, partial [Acidobacteriota bacterium]